jgi:hypothetical protein
VSDNHPQDEQQPQGFTIADALRLLYPPIPRRTLERRMREHRTPLPEKRKPAGRGRPAAAYPLEAFYAEHTEWAESQVGKRQTSSGGAAVNQPTPDPDPVRQSGTTSDVGTPRARAVTPRTVTGRERPADPTPPDDDAQQPAHDPGGDWE